MLRGWETYSSVVRSRCFDCINEHSRVLEIGPAHGDFTKLILEKNPKQCTLIEPDPRHVADLKKMFPNTEIQHNDIFDVLPTMEDAYDVVVAFGVLYHWSSPFKFLEDIANIIKPKYICLDNPDNDKVLIQHEEPNVTGNYWNLSNKKIVNLSIHLPKEIINTAMNNLNYKTLLSRKMAWHQYNKDVKQQAILFKFERI